jgi:VIT1/CCC1 family predicted Fe2+/Mn2+ transporter
MRILQSSAVPTLSKARLSLLEETAERWLSESVTISRPGAEDQAMAIHLDEHHGDSSARRLNQLRAAVLGANDGIVSVAGIVLGVAGAGTGRAPIFTAGLAGLVAGGVSMALGEYVSVSSQRDSENAQLAKEELELAESPEEELEELIAIYEAKGLSKRTATLVASELTANDPLAAHIDAELNLDPHDLANPLSAAIASVISFLLGGLLPLLAILLPPAGWRVAVTFIAVLLALALAGATSARIGGGSIRRAILRVVVGGAVGLVLTYGIGHLFGTAIG